MAIPHDTDQRFTSGYVFFGLISGLYTSPGFSSRNAFSGKPVNLSSSCFIIVFCSLCIVYQISKRSVSQNSFKVSKKKGESRKILLIVVINFCLFRVFGCHVAFHEKTYHLRLGVCTQGYGLFEVSRIFIRSVVSHLDCTCFPGMIGSWVYSGTVHPQDAYSLMND